MNFPYPPLQEISHSFVQLSHKALISPIYLYINLLLGVFYNSITLKINFLWKKFIVAGGGDTVSQRGWVGIWLKLARKSQQVISTAKHHQGINLSVCSEFDLLSNRSFNLTVQLWLRGRTRRFLPKHQTQRRPKSFWKTHHRQICSPRFQPLKHFIVRWWNPLPRLTR